MYKSKHRRLGFTLVEVVVAFALGGMVMTSVMALFIAFAQAWEGRKTPYESFVQHVDQCMRFLNQYANSIVLVADKGEVESKWFSIVKLSQRQTRSLSGVYALGMLRTKPLPFVRSAEQQPMWMVLIQDSSGLSFTWEEPEIKAKGVSEQSEASGKTKLQHFILSPYVSKMEYAFFDKKNGNWLFFSDLNQFVTRFSTSDSKNKGEWEELSLNRPSLRITFKKNNWEVRRFLYLNNHYLSELIKKQAVLNAKKQDREAVNTESKIGGKQKNGDDRKRKRGMRLHSGRR